MAIISIISELHISKRSFDYRQHDKMVIEGRFVNC